MKIMVAERGKFLQTMRTHASAAITVFPHGANWAPIIESGRAFEALLTHPIERLPTQPLESCET